MRYLLVLLLIIPLCSHAQNKHTLLEKASYWMYVNTDSSTHYLEKLQRIALAINDAPLQTKVYVLKGQHEALFGNQDLALSYFQQAQKSYFNQKQSREYIDLCLKTGDLLYIWAKYDQARTKFYEAYLLSKKMKQYDLKGLALIYLGKYYHSLGDYEESLNHYNKALKIAKEINDTTLLITVQVKIGKHHETLGNYAKALENYMLAKELLPAIENKILQATSYNHLGNIYHLLNELEQALTFHTQALKFRNQVHYKEGIAISLNNLGELYIDLNRLDSAQSCFLQSKILCEELNYSKGILKSTHNLGSIDQINHNFESAISHFKTALNQATSIGYEKGLLNAQLQLATVYFETNEFNTALSYAEQGLDLARETHVKSRMRDFYFLKASIYEKNNDLDLALSNLKAFNRINEELLSIESNKKITELENQFEASLKQTENERLRAENELNEVQLKRKNVVIWFVLTVLSLSIALILILYIRYQNNKNLTLQLSSLNKQISTQNKSLEELNAKLNQSINQQVKLFSIISHELRNPLWWFRNLIQMLTQKIDSLDKSMILKSLNSMNESANNTFHLMDNLLNWSRTQLGNIKYNPSPISLEEIIERNISLVQYLIDYKEINCRFDSKNEELVYADKDMVQTIIRNLLSNAIKYTPEQGIIHITTSNKKGLVQISISDTGIGMNQKTINQLLKNNENNEKSDLGSEVSSGLGLNLCKEFIELHGGKLEAKSKTNVGSRFSFNLKTNQAF